MQRVRKLMSLVVLSGCVLGISCWRVQGAPAPQPRVGVEPHVHAGRWELIWGGSKYVMTLSYSQSYFCTDPGGMNEWRGSWSYDRYRRTLHILESVNGLDWTTWTVTLHPGVMTGVANYNGGCVKVKLKPTKPNLS